MTPEQQALEQTLLAQAVERATATKSSQPVPKMKGEKGLFRKLGLPVMIGGQAADAISTIQALKRPGVYETNPLLGKRPSMGKLLGMKALTTLPAAFIFDKLAAEHPKLALGLALGTGALGFGLAARNHTKGRK